MYIVVSINQDSPSTWPLLIPSHHDRMPGSLIRRSVRGGRQVADRMAPLAEWLNRRLDFDDLAGLWHVPFDWISNDVA